MKQIHVTDSEAHSEFTKEKFYFKTKKMIVWKKENSALKSKSKKLEKGFFLKAHMNSECVLKKYETYFQTFIARNMYRSEMGSMIYGVSRNGKRFIGYVPPKNSMFNSKIK